MSETTTYEQKKLKMRLLSRTYLTESVLEAKFELDDEVRYTPGQFANILVAENTWRSYSIVDIKLKQITFLVDIRPGGPGSIFFRDLKYGVDVELVVPMGGFVLTDDRGPKLFVATGVGIAPFIPMIKQMVKEERNEDLMILWGIRFEREMYLEYYLGSLLERKNITFIPCISREDEKVENAFSGRVTDLLKNTEVDLSSTQCFICGNRQMVTEVAQIVRDKKAVNVIVEKY